MEDIRECVCNRHSTMRECKLSMESLSIQGFDISEKTLLQRRVLKCLITAKKEENKRILEEEKLILQFQQGIQGLSLSSLHSLYTQSLSAMQEIKSTFRPKNRINDSKKDLLFFEITQLYVDFFTSLGKAQKAEEIKSISQIQKVPVIPLMVRFLVEISRAYFKDFIFFTSQTYLKQISQIRPKMQGKDSNVLSQQEKDRQQKDNFLYDPIVPSQRIRPQTSDGLRSKISKRNIKSKGDLSLTANSKQQRTIRSSLDERAPDLFLTCNNFFDKNQTRDNSLIQRASSQIELKPSSLKIKPPLMVRLNPEKKKEELSKLNLSIFGLLQDVMEFEVNNCNSEILNIFLKRNGLKKEFEESKQVLLNQMLNRNNEIKSTIQKHQQQFVGKDISFMHQSYHFNVNTSQQSPALLIADESESPQFKKKTDVFISSLPLKNPNRKRVKQNSFIESNLSYLNDSNLEIKLEKEIHLYKQSIQDLSLFKSEAISTNRSFDLKRGNKFYSNEQPEMSSFRSNGDQKKQQQNADDEYKTNQTRISQDKFIQRIRSSKKINNFQKKEKGLECDKSSISFTNFQIQIQDKAEIDSFGMASLTSLHNYININNNNGSRKHEKQKTIEDLEWEVGFSENRNQNAEVFNHKKAQNMNQIQNQKVYHSLAIPNPHHSSFYSSLLRPFSYQKRRKSLGNNKNLIGESKLNSQIKNPNKSQIGSNINNFIKIGQKDRSQEPKVQNQVVNNRYQCKQSSSKEPSIQQNQNCTILESTITNKSLIGFQNLCKGEGARKLKQKRDIFDQSNNRIIGQSARSTSYSIQDSINQNLEQDTIHQGEMVRLSSALIQQKAFENSEFNKYKQFQLSKDAYCQKYQDPFFNNSPDNTITIKNVKTKLSKQEGPKVVILSNLNFPVNQEKKKRPQHFQF